jgi:hypothetical protein
MPQTLADRLEEGIYQIVAFVPQLALALGILIAGFAIAKMVERGTATGLRRLGFDRWMEEGGVTEALARAGTELDPSGVLAKLVFWTVMLLVILLASDALGLVMVSAVFAELLAYIPSVIAAIVILILGILLAEFVKKLVLASAGGELERLVVVAGHVDVGLEPPHHLVHRRRRDPHGPRDVRAGHRRSATISELLEGRFLPNEI